MNSETSITIAAPARDIYELARVTERWPSILPHYRYVHVLSEDANERTIEMAARQGIVPVRWIAIQRDDPGTPAIHFRHVWGWTKGTEVVWAFEERAAETLVTIVHDVQFRFPIGAAIEKRVVVGFFIEGIARRTLACMKRVAEGVGYG